MDSLPLYDACALTVSLFAFAAMEWSEGDNWSLEVDLSPGVTDFKCAVVRQNGSVVCWEPGANRTVEVHCSACSLPKADMVISDIASLVSLAWGTLGPTWDDLRPCST